MDNTIIAKYQECRMLTVKLEKQMEEILNELTRREDIVVDRCADYGQRGITLQINFDDINIMALSESKIAALKNLLFKHRLLRKEQRGLEREIHVDRTKSFAKEDHLL